MLGFIFSILYYAFILIISFFVITVLFMGHKLLRINSYFINRRECTSKVLLNGKTTIVTGGYRGIGFETAREFAKRGARVILPCRSMAAGKEARDNIIAETHNSDVIVMYCDLSDLESVQSFCQEFLENESSLHILVNCAAFYGFGDQKKLSKQGFDNTIGVNYIGHFLLTFLLLDILKRSSPSRIINVSSSANYECKQLNITPPKSDGKLLPNIKGYPASKLLNIMHTRYLAKKLQGTGITTYALHPGFILGDKTHLIQTTVSRILWTFFQLFKPLSLTNEQGAQTILHCALEESLNTSSGKFFDNCNEKIPNKLALDDDLAIRVWNTTLELLQDFVQ